MEGAREDEGGQRRGGGGDHTFHRISRISHLLPKHGLEHVITVYAPWRQISASQMKPRISLYLLYTSGVPRNFVRGGGVQQIQFRTGQRERGSGGGSPLVRGSGGSCNLVQEISFHIVKFS